MKYEWRTARLCSSCRTDFLMYILVQQFCAVCVTRACTFGEIQTIDPNRRGTAESYRRCPVARAVHLHEAPPDPPPPSPRAERPADRVRARRDVGAEKAGRGLELRRDRFVRRKALAS